MANKWILYTLSRLRFNVPAFKRRGEFPQCSVMHAVPDCHRKINVLSCLHNSFGNDATVWQNSFILGGWFRWKARQRYIMIAILRYVVYMITVRNLSVILVSKGIHHPPHHNEKNYRSHNQHQAAQIPSSSRGPAYATSRSGMMSLLRMQSWIHLCWNFVFPASLKIGNPALWTAVQQFYLLHASPEPCTEQNF